MCSRPCDCGNEHRLGANEAPPAIMSVFMGAALTRMIEDIIAGRAGTRAEQAMLALGVAKLPEIEQDNTDRNRTSPLAFTGAKFDFRAVGSSQSIAVVKGIFKDTSAIRFEGNGYSEAGVEEARKRGLLDLRRAPGGGSRR